MFRRDDISVNIVGVATNAFVIETIMIRNTGDRPEVIERSRLSGK